jgi:hypothetical protein
MSICIAAKCHATDPEVVLCYDWKVSSETVSAEPGGKFRWLNRRWVVLLAGVTDVSKEVVDIYERSLPHPEDETPVEALRVPLREWRKRLATAYIHDRHALTFEDFYQYGGSWLGQDVWHETQSEIGRRFDQQKTTLELILVGCVGSGPTATTSIFQVANGEVHERSELATAGTGYAVAEAALYWRMSHDRPRNIEQTIYSAYEAKKLSELSPYVGQQLSMVVVKPARSGDRLEMDIVDTDVLVKQFKRFGPKPYRKSKTDRSLYLPK